MSAMASTSASTASQPVVFTTQTQYPLPTQKFMIPISWKRYQLSQLVNKALSLVQPVPFDFIVRGEVLRTTLQEWCAEHSVGEVCLTGQELLLKLIWSVLGRNSGDRVCRGYYAPTEDV